jgi:hypothetical protein
VKRQLTALAFKLRCLNLTRQSRYGSSQGLAFIDSTSLRVCKIFVFRAIKRLLTKRAWVNHQPTDFMDLNYACSTMIKVKSFVDKLWIGDI